ncbi:hypothetical protein PJIAN_395 [Paludibacter jiangxiensis]|uniref:Uncharacterized protein n=2 Tax=Paludibacter jiangxiensis TaxID=681398 RepID=A0A170ZLG7_9BACT|nr:hypothetical protein PJIAN_395 [Paludibacter jiangxiensis]
MLKPLISFVLLLLTFCVCDSQPNSLKEIKLPEIGKWMERSSGKPADWLGTRFQNKELIEPINVVIIDAFAKTRTESIRKLMIACQKEGYTDREGHSSGYYARIDTNRLSQLPDEHRRALSDRNFLFPNNHGRIMGPEYFEGKYIFVGAFSREAFRFFSRAHHVYQSFTIARNDFCEKLGRGHIYRIIGECNLENRINSRWITTGDHDGEAILLYATR